MIYRHGEKPSKRDLQDTGSPRQNLANAIVQQAVDDYRMAMKYLLKHPEIPEGQYAASRWTKARKTIVECEAFFCGEWIEMLTDLDGKEILKKLRDEYGSKAVPKNGKEVR